MIRLGVAPRFLDFTREAFSTIDSWFNQVTTRFNIQQKAGAPVVSEVPNNQWGLWKDTVSGNVKLIVNDNGTLRSDVVTPPIFKATLSANQTIISGSSTKVGFDTRQYDSENWFDTVNHRYVPKIAGFYLFQAQFQITGTAIASTNECIIAVNGTGYQLNITVNAGIVANYTPGLSALVFLNGSTDFVEVFAFHNTGVNQTVTGSSDVTFLSGTLIRAA